MPVGKFFRLKVGTGLTGSDLGGGIVELAATPAGGPSGPAGGVLSGTYPNPGFAADMATQAELDAVAAARVSLGLLDAKGDLFAATANDTAARLPVGTNGQVLTADSAAATGVKWAAAPAPLRKLRAQQFGPMPGTVGSAGMYRVPYLDGASVTWTLARASLHLEKPGSTSSVLLVEKSSTADVFTPVLVATLTVAASGYSATDVTAGLGTLVSGNLLRFRWTALGTGADSFYAQLEGTE